MASPPQRDSATGRSQGCHLIEALGKDDAWETVYRDSRDMAIPEDQRLINLAVRRAMERKLGIPLHKDTATRYLQSQKR